MNTSPTSSTRKSILNFGQNKKYSSSNQLGSVQKDATSSQLNGLTSQSQELILRTISKIKTEDSQQILDTLNESRQMLRNSFEQFKLEQDDCRRELDEIIKSKPKIYTSKENSIPLSTLMRKRDMESPLDQNFNSTYQRSFEPIGSSYDSSQQHPTDRAAVEKYLRRRERRIRAEKYKDNHQLSKDTLRQQTAEIMQRMENVDLKLEHERERQHELIRMRMNEKKIKANNLNQANEIIVRSNDANLARERVDQEQRNKIEARLSAARKKQDSISMHTVHVRSSTNGEDDQSFNDEQSKISKTSLHIINSNIQQKDVINTMAVVHDYDNKTNKLPSIYI